MRNGLKERLAAGELALCFGCRIARTGDIGMIAATCGFDSFYIDMEHSGVSVDAAAQMCAAALPLGVTPLVRTPGHAHADASRLLDCGAQGIIYPHVNTAEQARAFVDACKFPPLGHRSVAGAAPTTLYRTAPLGELNEEGNAATLCIAMLETPAAIENAESIAAVSGIDMLLIGSNDLSAELGIAGDLRHPKLREAYARAARACVEQQKYFGIGGVRGDAELMRELVVLGARFIIAGSDVGYLMAAAKNDAAQIRAAVDGIKP